MESDNNIYYVYCISNNLDGKMYIGYTKRFESRMKTHCKANSVVGRAIRKHGIENFKFEKLCRFTSKEEACNTEIFMISELHTLCPLGYNVAEGGSGGNMMAGADEEKIRKRNENIGKVRLKMNIKEKENIYKKIKKTNAKKSDEEKSLEIERLSNSMKIVWIKKSQEQLERESKIKSENTKGSKNGRYVYLTHEQKCFIIQKKNQGLSYIKISKAFFKEFSMNVSWSIIDRVMKE
jgi:group I intron endonuclease